MPRQRRILVQVDVLDLHLVRQVAVLRQAIAERLHVLGQAEDQQAQWLLERRDHPPRLVGQREVPRGGQIPALVVLLGQVVEADQQGQDDHDADEGERAVAGRPLGERGAHLAPLAGGVEEDAGEARQREALTQRDQIIAEEPGGDAGENQGDARPAEDVGDATEHMWCLPAPPFAVHAARGQEQAERDHAHVISDVLGVQHAFREVVEVLEDRDRRHRGERRR